MMDRCEGFALSYLVVMNCAGYFESDYGAYRVSLLLTKSGITQKHIQIHSILMLDHNSANLNVIILFKFISFQYLIITAPI